MESSDYEYRGTVHYMEDPRESDALLGMGIVKDEIDENGKRSLTLPGAFAMTFRSVSPGKNIWGYIKEKKAEKFVGNV